MLDVQVKKQMDKSAKTKQQINHLISQRWSPRSFDPDTAISKENLEGIFEAARWAASSMNEQPWRYYYAHREEEKGFNELLDCLVDGNKIWAKNAAVLIAITYRNNFETNGKKNITAPHDTGLANAQLVLEALSRNIYAHMMGGFHKDKTEKRLKLIDETPICFMALGYQDEPEALPTEDLQKREKSERTRKDPEEIFTMWQNS
ncbi:MAG: nitroreductase [Bacteroidetes bacterium]|nr:nitroreductase [Bacteroidota bacterium]